jgi:hypothetical protein
MLIPVCCNGGETLMQAPRDLLPSTLPRIRVPQHLVLLACSQQQRPGAILPAPRHNLLLALDGAAAMFWLRH